MRRLKVAALVGALAALVNVGIARGAQTVTVLPTSPDLSNCYPFGQGGPGTEGPWTPYAAFVYKNIPAFALKPNDVIAFDLGEVNDADIRLDIAMAGTTVNGSSTNAEPFQTVVTNTQTPMNPRGDTVVGNFELQFRAEADYSFPGGGLIIRFSNPAPGYAADETCTGTLVHGKPSDSSGFFVGRALRDLDGIAPWTEEDSFAIGAFQIRTFDPPPDTDLPETAITKDVKRSETGKVKFGFASDEAATFECKLKGPDPKRQLRQFRACASPRKYQGLDDGRFKFKVRAVDAAGNVDPTPDQDRFRVVD